MQALIQGDVRRWLQARLRLDTPALTHRLADTLLDEARWFLPGSLEDHQELLNRALDVAARAHREDERQPLLALGASPQGTVGAALFLLALPHEGGTVGVIRRLHVGLRSPEQPVQRTEWGDLACQVVQRHFQRAPLADQLRWWIEPQVPSQPEIDGASMGFAAVAALTSLITQVPVPADLAFTGVLERSGSEIKTRAVAHDTLTAKIEIADRVDAVHTLIIPDANRGVSGKGLKLDPERRPAALASRVTSLTTTITLKAPGPTPPERTRDEAERRVLAVLIHAERPLRVSQIEGALKAWTPPVRPTPIVPDVLRRLGDSVRDVGGAWEDAEDMESGLRQSQDWRGKALTALATSFEQADRPLALVYSARAGDLERTRRLLMSMRTPALDLSAEVELLQRVRDRTAKGTVYGLLDSLPDDLPSRTLRLTWQGLDVPWPLAEIARQLIASDGWNDRLFTVQAMAEAALHLLASVALAEGVVPASVREKIDERPSVGLLYTAARALVDADQPLSPIGAQIRAGVHPFFARDNEAGSTLQTWLNQALHLPGSVARLTPGGCPPQLDSIVPAVLQLYTLTCDAFRDHQVHDADRDQSTPEQVIEDAEGNTLSMGQQLRRHDGGALWWRGHVDGVPRWWAYDSVTVFPAPAPATPAAAPLDVSTLPAPLAHAILSPRRHPAPIQHLAALRLGLASLLRLAWFPALCELDPGLQHPVETGRRPWLMRMNHRNLLTELTRRAPVDERPTGWLPMPPLWRLLDTIERLEHAPGPTATWQALLDSAQSQLTGLAATGPWTRGWRLMGRRGDQAVPLHGANPLRPHGPAPQGLEDGEVGWIGPDGACLRFGPFAALGAQGLRWVAQVRTRKKHLRPDDRVDVFTSNMIAPGMQVQTTQLEAAPGWPGGVRLSHEP